MMFETRKARYERLLRARQRTQTARKLRDAQARTYVALGSNAACPAGNTRSKYLHKR